MWRSKAWVAGALMVSVLAAWAFIRYRDMERPLPERASEDGKPAEHPRNPPSRIPEVWCLWCRQPDPVRTMEVAPGGDILITTSRANRAGREPLTVRFWSVADGSIRRVLEFPDAIHTPIHLRDGRIYMLGLRTVDDPKKTGSHEGIDVVDAETGRRITTMGHVRDFIPDFDVTPDGKRLAVWESKNLSPFGTTLALWDANTGREVCSLLGDHPELSRSARVAISRNGKVVTAFTRNTIYFWDVHTGEELAAARAPEKTGSRSGAGKIRHFTSRVDGACISFAGQLCAYTENTRADLHVYDIAAGRQRFALSGGFASSAFSPDDKYLAAIEFTPTTGEWDFPRWGTICVWDVETGRLLARNERLKSEDAVRPMHLRTELRSRRPPRLAFGPDSTCLFAGSDDGQIHRWDLRDMPR